MQTKPHLSTKAASRRGLSPAKRTRGDIQRRDHPMMGELYQRAEARLRAQPKSPRSKPGNPKLPLDPQRLLHELQVHQVELELQNAELRETRDQMEVLLANFTDLYDYAPVGYFSLDESGVILETNLTGATLLGLERSRLLNRRLPLFVAPTSRPIFLAFLENIFSGHKNQNCDALLVKEGGATFWAAFRATSALSPKGKRKWCRVAFGDVTERKEAEEALRESEKRYRTLFEVVPIAVYSCDAIGMIQKFNPRAADLWGRSPALGDTNERFCGSFKLLRPDGKVLPHAQCPMSEVVSGKVAAVHDAEVIIERPDGSRIAAIVNIRPLKNERGQVTGAINCFYDITERKREEEGQRRLEVLAASNRKLELEIVQRQTMETALKQSEQHQGMLLKQSRQMEKELRFLSRQVLQAQEDERKKISRELHDVIAQTLTGINIRLATLRTQAALDVEGLDRNIALTQQLVEKSVNTVHQFARELRPAVLDDLGLIPALHSFMESFTARTGVRTYLTAFAGVEKLDAARRTVLFRVAQEALTNVGRHAHASHAKIIIEKLPGCIGMRIIDDGKSFEVARVRRGQGGNHLGLLGMRERLEMVGGRFQVESAPGQGTAVEAQIPLGRPARGGGESRRRPAEVKATSA